MVTIENRARVCGSMALSADRLVGDFGGIERCSEPLLFAVIAGAFPKPRPADSGRTMAADQAAGRVLAEHFKDEDVLGDDDVAFHPHYLGYMGNAPRPVA